VDVGSTQDAPALVTAAIDRLADPDAELGSELFAEIAAGGETTAEAWERSVRLNIGFTTSG
jgi:hypothetical protein